MHECEVAAGSLCPATMSSRRENEEFELPSRLDTIACGLDIYIESDQVGPSYISNNAQLKVHNSLVVSFGDGTGGGLAPELLPR